MTYLSDRFDTFQLNTNIYDVLPIARLQDITFFLKVLLEICNDTLTHFFKLVLHKRNYVNINFFFDKLTANLFQIRLLLLRR